MIRIKIFLFLVLLLYPISISAQTLLDSLKSSSRIESKISNSLFTATKIAGSQSLNTAGKHELKMFIQHRFGNLSNGVYDFFGLDAATMRLGFEYGLNDNITLSAGRSTFEKTYDLGIKAKMMKQDDKLSSLSVSFYVGSSINTLRNIYPEATNNLFNRSSYTGVIMIGKKISYLSLQLSPVFIHNSYDNRISKSLSYGALGLGVSIELSKRISLTSEYFYGITATDFENYDPLSIGVDIDTGGHIFQLMISNSTGMFEKALLTNNTGNWTMGDIYFGFNLIRTFFLK